jgi:hypothetical protein
MRSPSHTKELSRHRTENVSLCHGPGSARIRAMEYGVYGLFETSHAS